jgi:hypothetical protein
MVTCLMGATAPILSQSVSECGWNDFSRIFAAFETIVPMRPKTLCMPCRCYPAPDSSDAPLRTRTILPATPRLPSNSCACLCLDKSMRDQRLDLLLFEEVTQGDQILSKQCRSQPFKPLDAVGDHPFPAGEKPAAGNVQPEDVDSTIAMTTAWSQSSPA